MSKITEEIEKILKTCKEAGYKIYLEDRLDEQSLDRPLEQWDYKVDEEMLCIIPKFPNFPERYEMQFFSIPEITITVKHKVSSVLITYVMNYLQIELLRVSSLLEQIVEKMDTLIKSAKP
ncbi:MAG: hypothetical protein ACFFC7_27255 [Candidatus Hermodarchaeota archaeon]